MKRLVVWMLVLALVLSLGTVTAFAREEETLVWEEADVSDRVLQSGGFLPEPVSRRGALRGDPYAGVKQAICEGLQDRLESIDITGYSVTEGEISGVYADVVNAHPELFYVTGGFRYSYMPSTSVITQLMPYYSEEYADDEKIAAFGAVCEEIVGRVDPDWTELQKYLFLHDYLVTHCEYEHKANENDNYTKYNAYDALVTHVAVCQGYSLAYNVLCGLLGLESGYISSRGLNHGWNLVTLDGEQFYVDCTWDDPSNDWYEGYCDHTYFLCSRDAFGHTGSSGTVTDWVVGRSNSTVDAYNGVTTSTAYDDAWFRSVVTAIPQLGSVAAYARKTDRNNVWLRELSDGTETAVPLEGPSYWYVWGTPGSFWGGNYSSFAALGDRFYFTTPTQIWSMDAEGVAEEVYAISEEEQELGFIYGLVEDGGGLYYSVGTKYCGVSFTRTQLSLAALYPSGSCGADLSWVLTPDGTLAISGTGPMDDYDDSCSPPWNEQLDDVLHVTVGSGVTSIGDHAFHDCTNLLSVDLPNSLSGIGDYAFADLDHVVDDVYYGGSRRQWSAIEIGDYNESLTGATIHFASIELPSAVDLVEVSATADAITVSWTAAEGAACYRLERQTENGPWELLGEDFTGFSYEDLDVEEFTEYRYRVTALNLDGSGESTVSSFVSLLQLQYLYAQPTDVLTAAELPEALPGGETPPDSDGIVWIPVARLAADITVDLQSSIGTLGKLIVPAGRTLTIGADGYVEAEVEIQQGGTVRVLRDGTLATTMGGPITNYGTLIVDGGGGVVSQMGGELRNYGSITLNGLFRCGSVRYPDGDGVERDHLWLENSGTFTGAGSVDVYDAGAGPEGEWPQVDLFALAELARTALNAPGIRVHPEELAITAQPEDVTAPVGSSVSFRVEASGEGLTYQWQVKLASAANFGNSGAPGAKTDTLTLNTVAGFKNMQVRCVVTDAYGNMVTSEPAAYTVPSALMITAQPQNFVGPLGSAATFRVEASGEGLTYQWQVKLASAANYGNSGAPGARTDTLTLNTVAALRNMQVRCVVTDKYGNTVTSESATYSE